MALIVLHYVHFALDVTRSNSSSRSERECRALKHSILIPRSITSYFLEICVDNFLKPLGLAKRERRGRAVVDGRTVMRTAREQFERTG